MLGKEILTPNHEKHQENAEILAAAHSRQEERQLRQEEQREIRRAKQAERRQQAAKEAGTRIVNTAINNYDKGGMMVVTESQARFLKIRNHMRHFTSFTAEEMSAAIKDAGYSFHTNVGNGYTVHRISESTDSQPTVDPQLPNNDVRGFAQQQPNEENGDFGVSSTAG